MPESRKEYTILIADDEKMNLDILGGILSPLYNLLVAKSGERALKLAKRHRPDLILLDIVMPGMSGFDVIGELKADDGTAAIPVIFITGLAGDEDEEKGFFLGAADYISKPFNKAVVKARVSTQLRTLDQLRIIERVCFVDTLTKISNRGCFEKRLEVEWSRAAREKTPFGILLMDIDNFKEYNDTYGHPQGDAALKAFAATASGTLLRAVDFIARWGGEEFVILLPGTGPGGAAEVAEKVRGSVEAAVIPAGDGKETRITVSVGAHATVPGAGADSGDFLEKADKALYRAKAAGRNRVVLFDEEGDRPA